MRAFQRKFFYAFFKKYFFSRNLLKSFNLKSNNNNMEGTKPVIINLEGTPPLRGEPYPTL